MKSYLILSFSLSVLLISCSDKKELIVDPSDPAIEYSGRINRSSEESVGLNWPGSSIRINFEGASIAVLFQDESGDNYYNVILDNDSIFILRPQTIKQYQVLASNLSKALIQLRFLDAQSGIEDRQIFMALKLIPMLNY